jgi:hypothetical protein
MRFMRAKPKTHRALGNAYDNVADEAVPEFPHLSPSGFLCLFVWGFFFFLL